MDREDFLGYSISQLPCPSRQAEAIIALASPHQYSAARPHRPEAGPAAGRWLRRSRSRWQARLWCAHRARIPLVGVAKCAFCTAACAAPVRRGTRHPRCSSPPPECAAPTAPAVQAMAGRPGPAYQTPCTGLTPSTYRTTRRSARPATTLADEWAHRRCGCWCGRLRTGSARTWWLGPDANDCVSLGPLKPALAGLNGGTDRGIARNIFGVEGIHASL